MTFVVCIKVGLIVFELLAIALMVAMLWDDFKKTLERPFSNFLKRTRLIF